VVDVSAVADPATGVALYDSFKAKGWLVYGGTSVSSPIIAAVYALAGDYATLHLQGAQRAYLSTSAADLFDVTSGSTAKCGTYLCTAGPGYDGPTGNGTPNGVGAF
jgi:subtilase family serine protease